MTAPAIYLLDTNIVSHLMRNAEGTAAQQYRKRLVNTPTCRMVTSAVVQCELLYCLTKQPSPRLMAAYNIQMQQLPVLALDDTVTPHYANLRTRLEQLGTPIGPNDLLIAAHAMALGATLVSGDSEFTRIPGLQVENWLQPSP